MRTLKILGFLLTYPSIHHKHAINECRTFLRQEGLLKKGHLKRIMAVLDTIENQDLLDLQEAYVDLFDRTPSLSLHLFEHVHGDSRERGQAMVDLSELYAEKGLNIGTHETPDYLPMFLEYVSLLDAQHVKENLGSIVNILSALAQRLQNRGSLYAGVLQALIDIPTKTPNAKIVKASIQKDSGRPLHMGEIDEAWKEQFAFENSSQTVGNAGACPQAQQMLTRMHLNPHERTER